MLKLKILKKEEIQLIINFIILIEKEKKLENLSKKWESQLEKDMVF